MNLWQYLDRNDHVAFISAITFGLAAIFAAISLFAWATEPHLCPCAYACEAP